MILTDTHTHLYSEDFDSDREELIRQAISKGIERFFLPNIDKTSLEAMLRLETEYPENCFAMIGLHPCSVNENWKAEIGIVEEWLSKRRFAGIGEMGIDLYWDKTFIEEQKEVFRIQISLANEYGLPVIIHSRDSFEVIYKLLKKFPKQEPCGIFHCFTGSEDQAKRATALGFSLGIGGVLTFKNSGLDKVIGNTGMETLVLETDAPYLAPAPFRGKRNLPEYLLLIARMLAEIKNMSLEEVAEITTENSRRIFSC